MYGLLEITKYSRDLFAVNPSSFMHTYKKEISIVNQTNCKHNKNEAIANTITSKANEKINTNNLADEK
jgi:hypothetical protein